MSRKHRGKIAISILILAISLTAALVMIGNNRLSVSNYEVNIENLPESFHGYRIVQISDLHNKSFGKNQRRLLARIESIEPDICVITGDYVSSHSKIPNKSLNLFRALSNRWRVYLVTGNHEGHHHQWDEVRKLTAETGVILLQGNSILRKDGDEISLIGTDDPAFTDSCSNPMQSRFRDELESITAGSPKGNVKILLSHRPELFDLYVELGYDLVFAGHAHGGLWRLPLVGGIVAPDQGLLPKYTSGVYSKHNTKMVVSRGLGPTIIPVRVLNPPEIVVVTLQ